MSTNENVKLSQDEIDLLLEWIKKGKSLKEMGEIIMGKPVPIIEKEIVEVEKYIAPPNPVVSVKLEYRLDDKRLITVGLEEAVTSKSKDYQEAHKKCFLELLKSLAQLIELSTRE